MRSTCQCAPAPQWAARARFWAAACALLALTAPTARSDAAAAAPAVAVATAAELAAAFDGGAAHIVVTDHLDLSDMRVLNNIGEPTTDDDPFGVSFVRGLTPFELASIRVRPLPHKVPAHLRFVLALPPACITAAAKAARRCWRQRCPAAGRTSPRRQWRSHRLGGDGSISRFGAL